MQDLYKQALYFRKKPILVFFLIILSFIVIANTEDYIDPITYSKGDLRWCKLNAECTLLSLTVDSITVYNLSVIGSVFNVTMNLVTWNITDSFNVGGDLTANAIDSSGNITINTGVNANPTLKYREGGIDNGFDILMKLFATNYLEFNAYDSGVSTTRMKIRRTQPEIEVYSTIDMNEYNISDIQCIELNDEEICDWDSVNVTTGNSTSDIWNVIDNGTFQNKLINSSNITCIGNQCYYNGSTGETDTTVNNTGYVVIDELNVRNITSPYANKSFIFFMPDGSVGITLDPIEPLEEPLKENNPITRTSSTETICSNGKCNLVLYSGVRFAEEDNKWKKIEEARSLKNSGIKCVVESDNVHLAVCDDFNYTHRKIKTSINALSAIDKTNIPVSVYYEEYNLETNKTDIIEKSKEFYNFELTPNKDEWIKASYGDIIKIGDKSTTIKLQEPDSENLGDSYIYELGGDTNYGTEIILKLKNFFVMRTFIKFNISVIPSSGIQLDESELFLYMNDPPSFTSDIAAHHIYIDSNWTEDTMTWNILNCGANFDDSSQCNLTAEDIFTKDTTGNVWTNWNVTNAVKSDYDANNLNVSFVIKYHPNDQASGSVFGDAAFYSKEYTGDTSLRPYLNITYHSILPSVSTTLTSPTDGSSDEDGTVIFNCSGTALFSDLVNITLYHNITGTWKVNKTQTVTGTSTYANFTITSIANNTNLVWNCLSSNDATNTSFADANWSLTIQIPPLKNPKFFIQNLAGDYLWYVNLLGDMWLSNDFDIDGDLIVDGNVGIGNTTPQHKLSVNGDIYAGNNVYLGKNITPQTDNYSWLGNNESFYQEIWGWHIHSDNYLSASAMKFTVTNSFPFQWFFNSQLLMNLTPDAELTLNGNANIKGNITVNDYGFFGWIGTVNRRIKNISTSFIDALNGTIGDTLSFKHTNTPDPQAGYVKLFSKDDNNLWIMKDTGSDKRLLDVGVGSALIDENVTVNGTFNATQKATFGGDIAVKGAILSVWGNSVKISGGINLSEGGSDVLLKVEDDDLSVTGLHIGHDGGSAQMCLHDQGIPPTQTGFQIYGINNSGTWELWTQTPEAVNKRIIIEGGEGASHWNRTGNNIYPSNLTDRIGIGTSSPKHLLDVGGMEGIGAPGNLGIKSDSGALAIRIEENSGVEGWHIGVDVDGDLNFDDSNTGIRLTFQDETGNVGIGTTNPGRDVEIYGTSSILRLRDSGLTASATLAYIEFGGTDAVAWNRTGYIGDGSSGNADIYVRAEVGDLHLGDSSGANVLNLQGGNVGIGNATPQHKLSVQGDIYANSSVRIGERIIFKFGQIIDGLKDGWLKFTAKTNFTDNVHIAKNITIRGFGSINQLVVGDWTPTDLSDSDSLTVVDGFDLIHTSTHSDDHAFEIELNADGYGDVKAIDISYTTGAITTGQDEEAILVNIDDFLSTGGTVIGLEVITTEGLANVYGMEVGALVNPILQLSGEFSNESRGTVNGVDRLTEFLSLTSDIDIFVSDNDNITIGSDSKFEEIEFIFNTTSSGGGITPVFKFSVGTNWTEFNPTDGTNGMRNNGVVVWLDEDIPSWNASGGEYLIQITRTKNTLTTNPIENEIRIVVGAIEYLWDKNGDISVNQITANALSGTYSNGEAALCIYDNGTLFVRDGGCN